MDDQLRESLDAALRNQYDILRLLGRGAMGAVYLARERALDRLVAIKVLRSDPFTPESLERFRREARIAAKLAHANILPLYTFGEVDGLGYYVMGYVHGESLAARLKAEGTLRATEARRVLADIADALDYAHRQGVVHRDIKPANVLIEDESGRALLADFGIAKTHDTPDDALTHTGVSLGTPHYMSPEQAVGSRDVDGRSDIYSLGVLGYTMLAGREPFAASSFQELVFKHVTQSPVPLRQHVPDVPDDLEAAVMRCLAKDAADRWQDGHSLKDSLAPDEGAEGTTAPELRELSSFGTWAALWALAWGVFAVYARRRDLPLVVLLALFVPTGFLFHAFSISRKGLRLSQVLRASFWAPKWWGMWWPRPLRRPGDVWARLPRIARIVRLVMTALMIAVAALVIERMRSSESDATAWFASPIAVAVPFVAMLIVILGALWWGRMRGLSTAENFWLLFGPTAGTALWPSPQVARLLTPVPALPPRAASRPEKPHDYVREISLLANALAGPSREAGSEAVVVARDLLDHIEQLDAELASMQLEADPAEVARLEQRLSVVGADRTEMRALLTTELDLIHRIAAQHEPVSRKRAHLADALCTLWLRIGELRAAGTDDAERLAVGARLQEICAASRQLVALRADVR